jgi:hypothetical protein
MKIIGNAVAAMLVTVAASAQAQDVSPTGTPMCELHIWPTENHTGTESGMLSALGGGIGAAIDHAAHAGKVATVTDMMREYLAPDAQVEQLKKSDALRTLRLADYQIVVEPALPSDADKKANPAVKAAAALFGAKIKTGARLSASTAPCYAELVGTKIFYYKAPMHGRNLFAGWTLRDFGKSGSAKPNISSGSVKNPLENFPPKTPEDADMAKAELRDAYAKDFAEYVQKKVKVGSSPIAAR